MKLLKSKWTFAAALACTVGFAGCSDWVTPEAEQVLDYSNVEQSFPETYYEALRAYKASDHAVSFGWFSDWVEPSGSITNSLAAIPDSMDIVSLWGGWGGLTEGRLADVKFVQEKKGTKVLPCTFTSFVGQNFTPEEFGGNGSDPESAKLRNEFWGWKEGDDAAIEASIRKYAQAMVDTVMKYNYDGIDLDYEPHYGYGGPLASDNGRMHILLEELGKNFGPKSAHPEKLLIVDGEPQSLNPETGLFLSYYVIQAYSGTSGNPASWRNDFGNLDNRLNGLVNRFAKVVGQDLLGEGKSEEEIMKAGTEEVTRRTIMCENLEPALESLQGGYRFFDRNGRLMSCPSMVGMAMWEPLNGYRKGGFGAYRFSNEAVNNPAYRWMRNAIQAQNPACN